MLSNWEKEDNDFQAMGRWALKISGGQRIDWNITQLVRGNFYGTSLPAWFKARLIYAAIFIFEQWELPQLHQTKMPKKYSVQRIHLDIWPSLFVFYNIFYISNTYTVIKITNILGYLQLRHPLCTCYSHLACSARIKNNTQQLSRLNKQKW